MATSVRVMCINKSDRFNSHERILYIGGVNDDGSRWRISQQNAIDYIEQDKFAFYVIVNGSRVNVIVAKSVNGNNYIKTTADGEHPNNLLSLPECPA